jgi:hypothetical protein
MGAVNVGRIDKADYLPVRMSITSGLTAQRKGASSANMPISKEFIDLIDEELKEDLRERRRLEKMGCLRCCNER